MRTTSRFPSRLFVLSLVAAAVAVLASPLSAEVTIWDGPTITFTKADYADWTLPANQDRITDNVWITRKDGQGIFNIKTETGYAGSSPANTQWAFLGYNGNSSNLSDFLTPSKYGTLTYNSWANALEGWPAYNTVNTLAVVHLVSEDIYFNLMFTSWTQGAGGGTPAGGGFSYVRTTYLAPPPTPDLIWTGGTSEWSTNPVTNWKDGASNPAAYADGKNVLFDDTNTTGSTTVNISGADVAPASVTFNNNTTGVATYTLTGAAITGATGLTKMGDGTLVVENANTYTGTTMITAGTLRAKNAAALPNYSTQTISVVTNIIESNSGSTLAVNAGAGSPTEWSATEIANLLANPNVTFGSGTSLGIDTTGGDLTYGTAITKANMGLTKLGANKLTLSARETCTGQTTVNGGTLVLGGGNHTLAVNNALQVNGGGTLDLGANSQYVGSLSSSTAGEGTGGIITGAGGTLTVNQANSQTFAGSIQGSVNLIKTGGRTLTLTSANSTTGTISVIGGLGSVRERNNTGDLGYGVTLRDGGTLLSTPAITVRNSTLNLDNTGTMDMADRVNDAAPITLDNGTIRYVGRLQTNSTETLGAVTVSGFSAITMLVAGNAQTQPGTHSATLTLASLTRNSGAIIHFNRGIGVNTPLGQPGNNPRVLLAGDDTSGLTFCNGTVVGMYSNNDNDKMMPVSYVAGLGFGIMGQPGFPDNFMTGGNHFTGANTLADAGPTNDFITGDSQLVKLGGQTINSLGIQGNNSTLLNFQAPGDTLTLDSGYLALWFRKNILGDTTNRGAITSGQSELFLFGDYLGALGGDNVNTIHSVIKDNGSLNTVKFVMNLARDTYLTANNTYTGGTVVSNLLAREDGGTGYFGGVLATLYLNGPGSGFWTIPNATNHADGLVMNSSNVTMLTNAGQIGSDNIVTLNGCSVLTLIGENTLAGIVFNSNGSNRIGTIPTVNVNPIDANPETPAGILTLTGNIISNPSNAAVIPIISGGKLDFGGAMRDVTVGSLPEGDFVGAAGLEISSAIQNGGITKKGPGKLILSGENIYTGDTIVEEGTLSITHLGSLDDASTVKIFASAVMDLDFSGEPDTIANLWLGSDHVAAGTYNSSTPVYGSFFTGAGSLLVAINVDANGDGVIDAADYIILKQNFGQDTTLGAKEGDFNGDTHVDWTDLQLLMAEFGPRSVGEAPAAPEPGSVMLLMFGAAALLRRRSCLRP